MIGLSQHSRMRAAEGATGAFQGNASRSRASAAVFTRRILTAYWWVASASLVLAIGLASFFAPVDPSMGLVQKLVYLHIPCAMAALLGSVGAFVGSAGYLWSHARVWDRVAHRSAYVVIVSAAVVLATGVVWGRSFWGVWWTWSPRLTFTLALFVLYGMYVVLRCWRGGSEKRASVAAVYACVAFLDAPLVYLSVRLIPDVHPTSIPLTGEMRVTLAAWFVATGMCSIGVVLGPALRLALRGRFARG